jgi:uncharacterized damage-inducible protein DinB
MPSASRDGGRLRQKSRARPATADSSFRKYRRQSLFLLLPSVVPWPQRRSTGAPARGLRYKSRMSLRELLSDTYVFMPPAKALEGLSTEAAERRMAPELHSIAEIVAHLAFWQGWLLQRCNGVAVPMVRSAREGWPAVATGSWPDIQARFLADLERAASMGDAEDTLDQSLDPPIEFPALANYTRRDVLTHIATHNAHHLGQVITIRQLQKAWPPPQGSWTW